MAHPHPEIPKVPPLPGVSPSDIARHKTANAKGDRGITSKESEFVFSTTQRLISYKFLSA